MRSTSASTTVIILAANNRIRFTMNGILDDAISGLLLLRKGIDLINDSKDHCTTQSSNDSSTALSSNDSNVTHTSDNSSATPTSSLPEKKRKYKKRGTSFKKKKGTNRAKYTYKSDIHNDLFAKLTC